MESLKSMLKNSHASMFEIFSFLDYQNLVRCQNINKRFYNSQIPRLLTFLPLSSAFFAYSFEFDDNIDMTGKYSNTDLTQREGPLIEYLVITKVNPGLKLIHTDINLKKIFKC